MSGVLMGIASWVLMNVASILGLLCGEHDGVYNFAHDEDGTIAWRGW